MTIRYVDGTNGNNANDGLAAYVGGGHGPKLTLNGAEDTPVVAGDFVWVRPGVYREMLTCDVSGGNAYSTGTVTLTNGSAVVTGSGTLWLANVAAQYEFIVSIIASGADGVANGTSTFTSAAGKFEASMIGKIIQINTKGSWKIGAVGAANSITLVDVNYGGATWPTAGAGLSYSVMSGEGPITIASVDLDTQLTLTKAWNGPTLTLGTAYLTYNPIRYIGDVAGEIWGVGGVVRVTGSDNDQTAVRGWITQGAQRNYRIFRGFAFDTANSNGINCSAAGTDWTIEDCTFQSSSSNYLMNIAEAAQRRWTIRRCICISSNYGSLAFNHSSAINNSGHIVEGCLFMLQFVNPPTGAGVNASRVGGITVRNCTFIYCYNAARVSVALTVGQTLTVNNCIFAFCYSACVATVLGELVEDYDSFYGNVASRTNVAVGANSNAYPPLFDFGILHSGASQASGFRFPPPLFGALSQWSQVRAIADTGAATEDLLGLPRPVTDGKRSWGAVQYTPMLRDTGTVRTGSASMRLSDAGRFQIYVPTTNVSTVFSVYVYREANYAGTNPQLIVKQPGQADTTVTDAGASGGWNQLTTTLTPAALPGYVVVELVSNNTAAAGNYSTYFDDLTVV